MLLLEVGSVSLKGRCQITRVREADISPVGNLSFLLT